MPVIDCTIRVAIDYDDTPEAANVANRAVRSLIKRAEKLGPTDVRQHTISGRMPDPTTEYAPPVGTVEQGDGGAPQTTRPGAEADPSLNVRGDVTG